MLCRDFNCQKAICAHFTGKIIDLITQRPSDLFFRLESMPGMDNLPLRALQVHRNRIPEAYACSAINGLVVVGATYPGVSRCSVRKAKGTAFRGETGHVARLLIGIASSTSLRQLSVVVWIKPSTFPSF